MKKVLFLIMMVLMLAGCLESSPSTQTARESAEKSQGEAAVTALTSVPIPIISYFQERRTVAKWAERWDKPGVVTYVYLLSFGNVIGYYVADGKPASTQSFLMPEETLITGDLGEWNGDFVVSAPDIDGAYGANNPGIRFFTAEGTAVEWGGSGACYLYSDAPLPLNVPRLNVSRN